VGGNMAFHCIKGEGYSTNIDKAETYTREAAQRAWEMGRSIDLPVSADHIDALAVWRVDHQYIPNENTLISGCTEYVAFIKGQWNGNDVYWLTDTLPSDQFLRARIFSHPDTSDGRLVWMPFSLADSQKRRTFDMANYNPRSMTTGAGIIKPDYIKRSGRRKDNPKSRWNCPTCGRISWQDNPYDFEGCRDVKCEDWKQKYFY